MREWFSHIHLLPFVEQHLSVVNRNFNPPYFLDSGQQRCFERDGFIVLRNIVQPDEIEEAYDIYLQLKTREGYNVQDNFESSGNFTSKATQQFVFDYIKKYVHKIAQRFADLDNCEVGDGGAFFIKPNTDKSILHPHQDSAVIDETKYYGIFVWIPLVDITLQNGPLYILPGSHLFGNTSRSQHIPWAFRHLNELLWEKMKPIPVNKGDIICFDTSVIHASAANNSDAYRIVACGALLPKHHQKVDYLLNGDQLVKYDVDSDYWLNGGLESSLPAYPSEKSIYNYPNPVKKKTFLKLLNTTP